MASLPHRCPATPICPLTIASKSNDSKNLGWQSRVRWILRPGREVFFVVNHGWIREVDADGVTHFRTSGRGVAAKAQYTLRF